MKNPAFNLFAPSCRALALSIASSLLLATATSAEEVIVINETWADGERVTQDLANNSMAWFSNGATSTLTATVGSMTRNASGNALAYFTDALSPVTIEVGQAIQLKFSVVFPGYHGANTSFAGTTGDLRAGLLYSTGAANRVTADNHGFSNAVFNPYTGYASFMGLHAGRSVSARKRDAGLNDALINTGTPYPTNVTGNSTAPNLSAGVLYYGTLTIARVSGTSAQVSYTLTDGTTTLAAVTGSDTSTYFTFDTVAFTLGSNTASAYELQQVEISIIPVEAPPEAINEMTTGDTLGTAGNWSLGSAPAGSTNPGSHKDLLFTTSSTALSHGGSDIWARSYNVTNGTSYTIRSNRAADQSTGTRFRAGSTGDSSTTFTNEVSGIGNDLVFLSNDSSLFFDGVNPVEDGPAPTFPLQNSGNFNISEDSTLTIGMNITGNFALKKAGAGTAVLAGSNTYTGLTTLGAGALEISGSNDGTAYLITGDSDGAAPALILAKTTSIPDNSTFTGSNSGIRAGRVILASAGVYTLGSLVKGNMAFQNTSASPATLTFTDASALTTGNDGGRTFTNVSENLSVTFASDLDIGSNNPTPNHGTINTAGEVTIEGDLLSTGTGVREFRKSGSGTLTLKGIGEHTGNTTLFAGTLALGEFATLPDTSAFTISAGAVLDTSAKSSFTMEGAQPFTFGINPADDGSSGTLAALQLVITDAVVELNLTDILDDPVYVLATYTSLEGTAFATEPDNIPSGYELQYAYQGNKIALVSTGTTGGFASWQSVNGATGGLDDDHDNDGVSNGIEYFLGGPNGNTTGFTPLPGVTNTAGTLSITWTKGSGYTGAYPTDFLVQTSDTLANWATAATSPTPNVPDTVHIDGDTVTYTFPTGTKKFARLKVTE